MKKSSLILTGLLLVVLSLLLLPKFTNQLVSADGGVVLTPGCSGALCTGATAVGIQIGFAATDNQGHSLTGWLRDCGSVGDLKYNDPTTITTHLAGVNAGCDNVTIDTTYGWGTYTVFISNVCADWQPSLGGTGPNGEIPSAICGLSGAVTFSVPAPAPPPPGGGTTPPPPPGNNPPPPPATSCTVYTCNCSFQYLVGGASSTGKIGDGACTQDMTNQCIVNHCVGVSGNPEGSGCSTQTVTNVIPGACPAPPPPPPGNGGGGGSCPADQGCGCSNGLPYTWLSCHQDITTATVLPEPVEVGTDLTIHAHSTASTNAAQIWISYGSNPQPLYIGDIFCTGLSPRDQGGVGNLTNVQDITFNCHIPDVAPVGPYSWELEMGNGWASGYGTIIASVPTPTASITHVEGGYVCLPSSGDDGGGISISWGGSNPVDHLLVAEQPSYSGVFTTKAVSGTSTDGRGYTVNGGRTPYKFWPGLTYYFQAQNSGGYTSEWSAPITPQACPNMPGSFRVTQAVSVCSGGVPHNHIVWSPSANTTFYAVNGGSQGYAPAFMNLSYDDYWVTPGVSYDYLVVAGNLYGSTSADSGNVLTTACVPPDTTPPQVSQTVTGGPLSSCYSPDSGPHSWSNVSSMSGTASDNNPDGSPGSGIQKVTVTVYNSDGSPFNSVTDGAAPFWSVNVPSTGFVPGNSYYLQAVATDNSSNVSTPVRIPALGSGFIWSSSEAGCASPYLNTTGGDVHSNTGINTPGGT